MAITLHRPAHVAALPTRRVRHTSRASQVIIGAVIALAAAPWALLWRSDEAEPQLDAIETGRHRAH